MPAAAAPTAPAARTARTGEGRLPAARSAVTRLMNSFTAGPYDRDDAFWRRFDPEPLRPFDDALARLDDERPLPEDEPPRPLPDDERPRLPPEDERPLPDDERPRLLLEERPLRPPEELPLRPPEEERGRPRDDDERLPPRDEVARARRDDERLRPPDEPAEREDFTSPSSITPRHAPVSSSSISTWALKRARSARTARLTWRMPRAAFSIREPGFTLMSTSTRVRRSESLWKLTTPVWVTPSVTCHLIRSSGRCSTISA